MFPALSAVLCMKFLGSTYSTILRVSDIMIESVKKMVSVVWISLHSVLMLSIRIVSFLMTIRTFSLTLETSCLSEDCWLW